MPSSTSISTGQKLAFISKMKTITAKSPQDSSFSFSRRYLHWKKKPESDDQDPDDGHRILTFEKNSGQEELRIRRTVSGEPPRKKAPVVSVAKLRSALSLRPHQSGRVVGTLFGHRRGHVNFAVQEEPNSPPRFLIEMAIPTSFLVREMASGLARIALECDRSTEKKKKKKGKKALEEEEIWRTYCNGKKYGCANRFECGAEEWRVLKAVAAITAGAGVLPAEKRENGREEEEEEGEVMYMRARFERVVGSRDSEAFYMMNPDGVGGSELSIFLLRV